MKNEANLKPIAKKEKPQLSGDTQTKNKKMKSKANFKNQENTASTCKRETYPNSHPQTNNKSKPNPNPKQSQSKPNLEYLFRGETLCYKNRESINTTESVHWTPKPICDHFFVPFILWGISDTMAICQKLKITLIRCVLSVLARWPMLMLLRCSRAWSISGSKGLYPIPY